MIESDSKLTILRIEVDEGNRTLIVSHHPEIGPIGIWLPEGGISAAPGNTIELSKTRIKVAPPTEEMSNNHNIRAILALENPEMMEITAVTENIIEED